MQTEIISWVLTTNVVPGNLRIIQIYVSEELTGASISNQSGEYINKGIWIGYYANNPQRFTGLIDPEGKVRERPVKLQGVTHWAELMQPPVEN